MARPPSPNKFFDYIAAGFSVICNYPGWLADLIAGNQCGIAVPPDAPGAFAEALSCLADCPEKTATLGRNARNLAESNYGRAQLAERFFNVIGCTGNQEQANSSSPGSRPRF